MSATPGASAYLFIGTILPERAQISLSFGQRFEHLQSGKHANAAVSIINNHVVISVDVEDEWDLFTLRNTVQTMIQSELAVLGFIHGRAYDFDIVRAISKPRGVDHVFGIEIPDLAARQPATAEDQVKKLREKLVGTEGIYLSRCLRDLVSAMKNPNDTGFYCYRAIEALRHHCAVKNALSGSNRDAQWAKFHEISGCNKEKISPLTEAGKMLRHAEISAIDGNTRSQLLTLTWEIVEKYLAAID